MTTLSDDHDHDRIDSTTTGDGTEITITPPEPSMLSPRDGLIRVAGLASLGAGAVHAAAIGVHADERSAAVTFTVVAVVQLVWGALALMRPTRPVAALGFVLSGAAFVGWFIAKAWGLWFIPGLDVAESVQLADGISAALALAAALALGLALMPVGAAPVAREWRTVMPIAAVGVLAVSVIAMSAAGNHVHDHGSGTETAAAGHTHSHADGTSHSGQPAVATAPYDPAKPLDLSGVPGVTPKQQADAENLVAVTLKYLPQWSDPAYALANGFHSIGDALTGNEHFVNETFMNDDVILDPNKPESLVWDTTGGTRKLAAAMFMIKPGTPLDQVPDIGGALMQWHTHENLCYNDQGKVAGITDGSGNCRPGLVKPPPTPMIHVWIRPHKCGPFAALEGIGGGTIKAGETVACDHVHGAPT